jgi:hypothetical protein
LTSSFDEEASDKANDKEQEEGAEEETETGLKYTPQQQQIIN